MKQLKKLHCKQVLAAAIAIIGAYMIFAYGGGLTPPTLSGLAFILIAITFWTEK